MEVGEGGRLCGGRGCRSQFKSGKPPVSSGRGRAKRSGDGSRSGTLQQRSERPAQHAPRVPCRSCSSNTPALPRGREGPVDSHTPPPQPRAPYVRGCPGSWRGSCCCRGGPPYPG